MMTSICKISLDWNLVRFWIIWNYVNFTFFACRVYLEHKKLRNCWAINETKLVGAPWEWNRGGSNTPCKVMVIGVVATYPRHNGWANKCATCYTGLVTKSQSGSRFPPSLIQALLRQKWQVCTQHNSQVVGAVQCPSGGFQTHLRCTEVLEVTGYSVKNNCLGTGTSSDWVLCHHNCPNPEAVRIVV